MAANDRSYTGGRFMLEIGSYNVGYLKKFSGLSMEADIATSDLGPDNIQKKNVANIKWTPGKATVGMGMGYGMYQWIKAAFDKGYQTQNGSFVNGDFNYKAMSRVDFQNALITSVTVPKLDGSSKDAAYFDVEFEAEQVRWMKGDGKEIQSTIGPKQKRWLCSNFKFELAGLEQHCSRIASIDSFTWKCAVASDQVGLFKEPTKHPAKVTVPDLKLSISMADYEPWAQEAKKWFIDGQHGEENEKTGSLLFLGPDMDDKKPLGRIDFQNVGFKKFSEDDREGNSEKISRFTVELYVEKMAFTINEYDA